MVWVSNIGELVFWRIASFPGRNSAPSSKKPFPPPREMGIRLQESYPIILHYRESKTTTIYLSHHPTHRIHLHTWSWQIGENADATMKSFPDTQEPPSASHAMRIYMGISFPAEIEWSIKKGKLFEVFFAAQMRFPLYITICWLWDFSRQERKKHKKKSRDQRREFGVETPNNLNNSVYELFFSYFLQSWDLGNSESPGFEGKRGRKWAGGNRMRKNVNAMKFKRGNLNNSKFAFSTPW